MTPTATGERPDNEPCDRFGNKLGRGGWVRYRGDGGPQILPRDYNPRNPYHHYRNGKPKLRTYATASGCVIAANRYGLEQWMKRMVAVGMVLGSSDLDAARDRAVELVARGVDLASKDDAEAKALIAEIVEYANEAAGVNVAPEKGTLAHLLTEVADAGSEADMIAALAGADTSLLAPEAAARVIDGWRVFTERRGLVTLHTEVTVVNDRLEVAGTADRVLRLDRDLVLAGPDGNPLILDAGSIVLGDIKTGNPNLEKKAGYAGQVAAYAGGVPYDPAQHVRGEWDEPIRQDYGLIIHADLAQLADVEVDAESAFTLWLVDLDVGRALVRASNSLRTWTRRVRNVPNREAAAK